jgi:hypothetical protein
MGLMYRPASIPNLIVARPTKSAFLDDMLFAGQVDAIGQYDRKDTAFPDFEIFPRVMQQLIARRIICCVYDQPYCKRL